MKIFMCGTGPGSKFILAVSLLGILNCFLAAARADVTALSPAQASVAGCKDYFTSEWATPLDMNDSGDILYNLVPRESQQLSAYSFANGVFSTTATGADPYFRLLTWLDNFQGSPVAIPDDTTRFGVRKPIEFTRYPYRQFTFRMYSSVQSDYQVLWDKQDGAFAITNAFTTFPGWNTYTLDLATAGLSDGGGANSWTSGPVTGIRVDPVRNNVGAEIKLDWAQLTPEPAACSTLGVNYTTNAQDLIRIFVDDNTNPSDGFQASTEVLAAGTGSGSFNTASLFPGSYNLMGLASQDYATLNLHPWDMDDSAEDIDSSRIFNITKGGNGFSSGKFCGTASADDANFYLHLPHGKPIDASTFKYISVRLELPAGFDTIGVFFFDTNLALLGSATVATNGSGVYSIDLGNVAGWNGQIGSLRINPILVGDASGKSFCVDWVALGSAPIASEPQIRSFFQSGQAAVISDRPVVTFLQPDREGGEDFFSAVRGQTSQMSSLSDIQHVDNVSAAFIYPGNAYVESSGATRVGDYFEARSRQGSDDPTNFSVFLDNTRTIDPEKYKIACFTLDVLKPVTEYHSVARILWQRDSQNVNGDDIVLKTSGESRYCVRLDTLQVEPAVAPGPSHPWRRNSDGTGINYWRIDAHEESNATSYRFQDIRVAADHRANNRFLIVVDGSLSQQVNLYYSGRGDGTQGTLLGTLGAGRNSNVFAWDTSAVPDGVWYLYLTVGAETYLAPGPVVVSHSITDDSTVPVLSLDAPLNGHRFVDSLEIAGHAVDNFKLATIEVFFDGQLVSSFLPSDFRKNVRDAYPSAPNSSHSGFQRSISLGGASTGSHTVLVKAYDTAGNSTEYNATVEKVLSDPTAAISYPVPNEAAITVPISQPPASPTSAPPSTGALGLSTKVSKNDLTVQVSDAAGCSSVSIIANLKPNNSASKISKKATTIFTGTPNASGQVKAVAKKLKSLKGQPKGVDTKVYFAAFCNGARQSSIKSIDAKKIKASKGPVKNMKAVISQFKKLLKAG